MYISPIWLCVRDGLNVSLFDLKRALHSNRTYDIIILSKAKFEMAMKAAD